MPFPPIFYWRTRTRVILYRTSPRSTIWQAIWAARTCAPSPAFPRLLTTSVFGYLCREDWVFHRRHLSCKTGEDSSAKNTVVRISIAARENLGMAPDGTTRCNMQTNIVHTLANRDNAEGGAIWATVSRIEYDTDKMAQDKWRELYPDTEPAGLFMAKVDVSEIPMDELQASLPAFEHLLLAHGYGLYCIDYTQDFSGVLDREVLVDHLCTSEGFREQGDLASAMCTEVPMILANAISVWDHVCTWVRTSKAGYTVRTKAYIKVVSNFEAGEIWEPIGGHLADYVNCLNEHLRRTFLHPALKSLCTPSAGETSRRTRPKRWWRRPWPCFPLGSRGTRSVVSRLPSSGRTCPRASIYVLSWPTISRARYSSPGTRIRQQARSRVSGSGPPRQTRTKRRVGHGRLRVSYMSHLPGWHSGSQRRGCRAGAAPMLYQGRRCRHNLGSQKTTYTIASKRSRSRNPPAALCLGFLGLEGQQVPFDCHRDLDLSPPRGTRNCTGPRNLHALDHEPGITPLADPRLGERQRLAAMCLGSTRGRIAKIQGRAATLSRRTGKPSGLVAKYRRYEEKSQQTRDEVEDILRTQTDKVADIPSGRKWLVLGYRRSRATSAQRVVLRCCKDDEETTCIVWATQGLERVLDGCADVFEADTDKFGRTTFWLPLIGDGMGLEIEIESARVFQPGDGRKVSWNPIGVVAAPDPQRLATLQALAEKEQEHQAQLEAEQRPWEQSCLLEAPAPNPKDTKKALNLPSGEYLCRRYAPTTFRGAYHTLLFLVPADEDGEPATDVERLFLEGEVAVIGSIEALQKAHAPLLCYLGAERTMPQKKKDRLATLATVRKAV